MRSPLNLAIVALVTVGIGAAAYALFSATQVGASSSLSRFAKGELRNLIVLPTPPVQPTTVFKDAEGADRTLADFRGQVVLLNIWATWCAPCVKEMPALNELQAVRGSDQFIVVPISFDRSFEEAADFYAEFELNALPLFHERTLAMGRQLEAAGMPLTVLYDTQGRELARVPREAEWASADALALIDAVLAQEFPAG